MIKKILDKFKIHLVLNFTYSNNMAVLEFDVFNKKIISNTAVNLDHERILLKGALGILFQSNLGIDGYDIHSPNKIKINYPIDLLFEKLEALGFTLYHEDKGEKFYEIVLWKKDLKPLLNKIEDIKFYQDVASMFENNFIKKFKSF